jgi:DNA-binding LacI/PurR family transcriptional regulator
MDRSKEGRNDRSGKPQGEGKTVARLIDVAKAAGVSRSTASNVFNNPEMVRPKLRQRVEAAARDLGYLGPDPKGRLLRAGKFNAIAVMPPSEWGVADSLRNPVYDLVLLGVGQACDEIGANLVLVPDGSRDRAGAATPATVRSRRFRPWPKYQLRSR